MTRRELLASSVAVVSVQGRQPLPPIRIEDVTVSHDPPRPQRSARASDGTSYGQPRGTMSFRLPNLPESQQWKGLEAYDNRGGQGQFQCPELIIRYASKLGFIGFSELPTSPPSPKLGDGYQVARHFASRSDGRFSQVRNAFASLPRIGSVISVLPWSNAYPGSSGHVGIVFKVTSCSTNRANVSIFDQNNELSTWKSIEFSRPPYDAGRPTLARNWTGVFTNRGLASAVEWTEPVRGRDPPLGRC